MAFGRGSTTVPSTSMASFFAKLPDSFRTRQKRPGSLPGATTQVYGPTSRNVYHPARGAAPSLGLTGGRQRAPGRPQRGRWEGRYQLGEPTPERQSHVLARTANDHAFNGR